MQHKQVREKGSFTKAMQFIYHKLSNEPDPSKDSHKV